MKKLILLIVFLLSANIVSALTITEVMYNPATEQGSDTSLEWIEIYNNDSSEDLSLFSLDGNFLAGTISRGEYLIVARNLQGFEEYYGNNDSVWNDLDGNYKVIESSFSLSNSGDIINLTKGNFSESLNYSSAWGGNGNGFTLQKISLDQGNDRENWNESSVYGGTPGRSYEQGNDNQVKLKVEIESSIQFLNISLLDESSRQGFQIFPEPDNNKTFQLNVNVSSLDGIKNVSAIFRNKEYYLNKNGLYITNLSLEYYAIAGNYTINITAIDMNNETVSREITFEYLGMLSSLISVRDLDFGKVKKGSYSNEIQVSVFNKGNLELDLEIIGNDLKNGEDIILPENVEAFSNDWIPLSNSPTKINTSIFPDLNSKKDLKFRIKAPLVKKGVYQGNIEIISLEK